MAEQQLRYAIFSTDESLRARVKHSMSMTDLEAALVAEVALPFRSVSQQELRMVRDGDPYLLFLDMGDDAEIGLQALRFLSEENPARVFVVFGPELTPAMLLEAMRSGAAEYLTTPVTDPDIAAAIARVTRRVAHTRPAGETKMPGRVFAFFGAKGGTGVTTTATNMAVHLRQATGQRTLLLDLDLDLGNAAFLLGQKPRFSFVDVIRNFHRLDDGLLSSYVEEHATGLHLLSSPPRPELSERITREQMDAVLQFLRRHYDHIVVDLARPFSPLAISAFQHADVNFLVTTPELPALHNIKRFLPTLDRATGTDSRRALRIVLNRVRASDVISSGDVKEVLGMDVYWQLAADDEALVHSINVAKPIVLNGSSRYSRDLKAMAMDILGVSTDAGRGANVKAALQALVRPFRGRDGKADAPAKPAKIEEARA